MISKQILLDRGKSVCVCSARVMPLSLFYLASLLSFHSYHISTRLLLRVRVLYRFTLKLEEVEAAGRAWWACLPHNRSSPPQHAVYIFGPNNRSMVRRWRYTEYEGSRHKRYREACCPFSIIVHDITLCFREYTFLIGYGCVDVCWLVDSFTLYLVSISCTFPIAKSRTKRDRKSWIDLASRILQLPSYVT